MNLFTSLLHLLLRSKHSKWSLHGSHITALRQPNDISTGPSNASTKSSTCTKLLSICKCRTSYNIFATTLRHRVLRCLTLCVFYASLMLKMFLSRFSLILLPATISTQLAIMTTVQCLQSRMRSEISDIGRRNKCSTVKSIADATCPAIARTTIAADGRTAAFISGHLISTHTKVKLVMGTRKVGRRFVSELDRYPPRTLITAGQLPSTDELSILKLHHNFDGSLDKIAVQRPQQSRPEQLGAAPRLQPRRPLSLRSTCIRTIAHSIN